MRLIFALIMLSLLTTSGCHQTLPDRHSATSAELISAQQSNQAPQLRDQYLDSIILGRDNFGCADTYKHNTWPAEWYCLLGQDDATTTIGVMGDSHALALLPAFRKIAQGERFRFIFSAQYGCPTVLGMVGDISRQAERRGARSDRAAQACNSLAQRMLDIGRAEHLDGVVIAESWIGRMKDAEKARKSESTDVKSFAHSLEVTVDEFVHAGIPIMLLRDTPRQGRRLDFRAMVESLSDDILNAGHADTELNEDSISESEYDRQQSLPDQMIRRIAERHPDKVSVVDFAPALCSHGSCPIAANGSFLYYDGTGHLSEAGAWQILPLLRESLITWQNTHR